MNLSEYKKLKREINKLVTKSNKKEKNLNNLKKELDKLRKKVVKQMGGDENDEAKKKTLNKAKERRNKMSWANIVNESENKKKRKKLYPNGWFQHSINRLRRKGKTNAKANANANAKANANANVNNNSNYKTIEDYQSEVIHLDLNKNNNNWKVERDQFIKDYLPENKSKKRAKAELNRVRNLYAKNNKVNNFNSNLKDWLKENKKNYELEVSAKLQGNKDVNIRYKIRSMKILYYTIEYLSKKKVPIILLLDLYHSPLEESGLHRKRKGKSRMYSHWKDGIFTVRLVRIVDNEKLVSITGKIDNGKISRVSKSNTDEFIRLMKDYRSLLPRTYANVLMDN